MSNSQNRSTTIFIKGVLPPGIEDDVVFGIMWIRVGSLKLIRPSTQSYKVNIQFWGENTPATLYTSQTVSNMQEYDVKCPVTLFEKYLLDMKRNLKIQVEGVGHAHMDFGSYLKPKITITTKIPFEHFKGFFDVIAKNGKKAGSLELQMCANFNPEIAVRQLGEEQAQQQDCPASNIKNCMCSGFCKCKPDKITALDVVAVEKPQLFRQFYEQIKQRISPKNNQIKPVFVNPLDNRIPNSLNVQPTKAAFDPQRYFEPELSTPKVVQNFPTVQKILTYSNLRLKKQEEGQQQEPKLIITKDNKLTPIKDQSPTVNLNPAKSPIHSLADMIPASRMTSLNKFPDKFKQSKETLPLKSDKKFQQIKPDISQQRKQYQQIIPIVQEIKGDVSLSGVSEVQKVEDSVSVDANKQILSRVVNLNQELQKQKRSSPLKYPLKETSQQKIVELPFKPTQQPLQAPPIQRYLPQQKRKNSSLMLNMIVQIKINTIKLSQTGKFIISYRPYGQKENIKTGPHFTNNNLMIVFPVGEQQVSKMNKIPFIIQFWGATKEVLLGVIKLSLVKIHRGFIYEGRLNELAIKTSIFPTVIERGVIAITTLTDKQIGQTFLSAHIGTTSQIQTYLNTPKKQNNVQQLIEQPAKDLQDKKQKQLERENINRAIGNLSDLTSLLNLIDGNINPNAVEILIKFMNNKSSTSTQLLQLMTKLQFKGGNVFNILSSGNNTFQCKQLALCFQDCQAVKEKINQKINFKLKFINSKMMAEILQKLKDKSNFGVIAKQDLLDNLPNGKDLKDLFADNHKYQNISDWLKSLGKITLKQIKIDENKSIYAIMEQIFFQQIKDSLLKVQQLLQKTKGAANMTINEARQYFAKANGKYFSIWFWMFIAQNIYQTFDEKQQKNDMINTSLLFNWIALKLKQQQRQDNHIQEIQNSIEHQEEDIQPIQINKLVQEPTNQISPKSCNQTNKQQQIKQQPTQQIKNQISQQNNKQQIIDKSSKQQNIFQHKFTISIEELHLQQSSSGQCVIIYKFPFEDEQISSRRLHLLLDKHKYKIQCIGTHKFCISQPIEQYLGESTLSVRVTRVGEGELYGDLHSDQLVTQQSQFRVIPLFTANRDGIAGKIKLKIQYSTKKAVEMTIGRQTIRDVFLPKNGYLNFELSSSVDQTKIRQQLNMKEEFYLLLSLDIFGQNNALAPHYPPFNSKLYSDFSSAMTITGSYKITLTPQILNHLKNGSCIGRLILVYYAKQRGNYQRKQLLVGSFKAPLLSLISQQGLKGDYAFKNKLGMFVSLAHCSIRYQKSAKNQIDKTQSLVDAGRDSYWLIIDFTQIINFQGQLGWAKFEIVNRGKKLSTQKILIRQQGFIDLQSKCLYMQMGEQQFTSTKLLAVSFNTSTQHFGMDVNLRSIAKTLTKQKYAVDSTYFMVVDDQSRSRKIRVGAKIYAFRGQATLGTFAEALSRNSLRLNQEYEKQQNYQFHIQNMRKQLKMSARSLEEALSIILDKRKRQKLSQSFFTHKIKTNLDLSPIIASNTTDINQLIQQLPSQVDEQHLCEHIEQLNLRLINLRPQFVERFNFSKLNENRLDQNVEYFGLHQQIDLLVFIRKIKIEEEKQNQLSFPQKEASNGGKMVRISIIRGYNFHLLYNGIKPNARVRIPQIGLQTEVAERSSQPIFNQHMNLVISDGDLRKIKIEAYHEAGQDSEQILIGQGILNISESMNSIELPHSKIYRAILLSEMSNKMQAAIDIKVEISGRKEGVIAEKSFSQLEESIGDSRIEEIMERVKNTNAQNWKAGLFESSDQD